MYKKRHLGEYLRKSALWVKQEQEMTLKEDGNI